ncbi:MAG: hypothetical protein REI78_06270 [Pedobacter sp.]|nr:hypothetical protein [Pedobacter sp.]MDQ8052610.1 hypothetical protein [Pedobacter sp.]
MKKFFGVLLIIIGSLFMFLCLIGGLPVMGKSFAAMIAEPSIDTASFFIGTVIGAFLIIAITGLPIFFGVKLTKKKKVTPMLPLEEY